MRVQDVPGNRYQRAMKFLRLLGDALSWKSDRLALALFAHVATPQIRLTTDPNTFFFFLDHLDKEPPFRIEEDTTWDTNLELGLHWGIRMIERDEELHGKSPNAKMFLVLSDGELWSGEVQKALEESVARNIPIFVVGVGTLAGGRLPAFYGPDGEEVKDPDVPLTSRLDRPSLQQIAYEGGGQYFELDRDGDRQIANALIDAGKRLAPSHHDQQRVRTALLVLPDRRRRSRPLRHLLPARARRSVAATRRRRRGARLGLAHLQLTWARAGSRPSAMA